MWGGTKYGMGASWHGAQAVAAERAPVGPNPPGRPARPPARPSAGLLVGHGTNGIVVAPALCVGLLPVVAPEMYAGLPVWARTVFGGGVAGALAAVVLAAVFGRLGPKEEILRAKPVEEPLAGAEVGSAP